MKRFVFTALGTALSVIAVIPAYAVSATAVVTAVQAASIAARVAALYAGMPEEGRSRMTLPVPRADTGGQYLCPYTQAGTLTAWAEQAQAAATGGVAGNVAGEQAANQVAARVPFAGLFKKEIKETAQAQGAAAAAGGWEHIRQTSELSFDKVDDLAVFMHGKYSTMPDYDKALASAMSLYPELYERYEPANQAAVRLALIKPPSEQAPASASATAEPAKANTD
jgi:hypothetical protein